MSRKTVVASMIAACILTLSAGVTFGQPDYPSKPIRIVTSGTGGGNDFVARQIAQGISGALGQPVVIDNRSSGVIPGQVVFQAPPDGYTLLVAGNSHWFGPLMQKAPYDPVRDFSPISIVDTSPSVLIVHPSMPVKSVKELIALAKARPGELNNASSGLGSAAHLIVESFKAMAGVNIVAVPYASNSQEIQAIISGEVQVSIKTPSVVIPLVKVGKVKALAVTSMQPSVLAPGLPTVAATVPGYEAVSVTGIFAPAKTPATVINRLNQEIVRFLNTAEAKQRFLGAGSEVVGSSPEQLAATMQSEMARLGKVIKDAGIKTD